MDHSLLIAGFVNMTQVLQRWLYFFPEIISQIIKENWLLRKQIVIGGNVPYIDIFAVLCYLSKKKNILNLEKHLLIDFYFRHKIRNFP